MAFLRFCKTGGEEHRINQKLSYIQQTMALSVGEHIVFDGQEIQIPCKEFLTILSAPEPFSVSTYEFTSRLSVLKLEEFLAAVVEASERAEPISLEEFKRRNGIGLSVKRSLEEQARRREKGDFQEISSSDGIDAIEMAVR